MTRPRLIPCLVVKNGFLMRSQNFKVHQNIGNPVNTIMRFSDWNIDELVVLDISRDDYHDLMRDDLHVCYEGSTMVDLLRYISKVCFIPLAVGGRIRTLEDMRRRLEAGADKCVINTKAVEEPSFINEASRRFGAQCIVVSIDVKRHPNGRYEVYSHWGMKPTGMDPVSWARRVEKEGAGEIFLNSIDRDGSAEGYDIELIKKITNAATIPIIACGGVGKYSDIPKGIIEGGANAAAASNIFHFFELSYPFAKKTCIEAGIPMRPVRLGSKWFPREPVYGTVEEEDDKRQRRIQFAEKGKVKEVFGRTKIIWCKRCLYPSISSCSAYDEEGVCMGCRTADIKNSIPESEWKRRHGLLREILEKYRSKDKSTYDCVIAVSGGKDSYFITHTIKNEFGLNPLLVTYNGNNYLPEGWRNLLRMKEVFGADHIIYSPGVELLKKLNRLGFTIMGDMNWHAHVGITTVPIRVAVQNKVPLVIWGEHGYLDVTGSYSMADFPEMSYRDRVEHFARGYEWNYMAGRDGITSADMIPWKYPSDQELFDLDVRGIYMGNYVFWEANKHGKSMIEKYDFEVAKEPFERTYRRMSNLDDMHENGMHDYLKYIKFGYGRCTDHASKDIRAGLLSRSEGVELVRKMDHIKSRDIKRWLSYVGMAEEEFDRLADTFRDPRVWRKENGAWVKDNIWD